MCSAGFVLYFIMVMIMEMESKKKKATYDIAYAKAHLKRIPLDMQLKDYEALKAAADQAGEKVNAYIKKAIAQRMERDKETDGDT